MGTLLVFDTTASGRVLGKGGGGGSSPFGKLSLKLKKGSISMLKQLNSRKCLRPRQYIYECAGVNHGVVSLK